MKWDLHSKNFAKINGQIKNSQCFGHCMINTFIDAQLISIAKKDSKTIMFKTERKDWHVTDPADHTWLNLIMFSTNRYQLWKEIKKAASNCANFTNSSQYSTMTLHDIDINIKGMNEANKTANFETFNSSLSPMPPSPCKLQHSNSNYTNNK